MNDKTVEVLFKKEEFNEINFKHEPLGQNKANANKISMTIQVEVTPKMERLLLKLFLKETLERLEREDEDDTEI